MMRWLQVSLLVINAMMLAVGAAVVSYLAHQSLRPAAAEFLSFEMVTPVVRRGETVAIKATYRKRYDCPGKLIADLDDSGIAPGRQIQEQMLGNREPGTWQFVRRYQVPSDTTLGEARIREILIYDCPWRTDLVRSPWANFAIVE